jgi:hypothetical protein
MNDDSEKQGCRLRQLVWFVISGKCPFAKSAKIGHIGNRRSYERSLGL